MSELENNKAYEVNVSIDSDGTLRLFAVLPEKQGIGTRLLLVDITNMLKQQFAEPH